jgi:nitroreductase
METANLASLIKSRRSVRKWQSKQVPEELLLQAVELATWASNAGNFQNWKFYIIYSEKMRNAITDAYQTSTDKVAGWAEAGKYGADVERWRQRAGFMRNAPAMIAVTVGDYQSIADKILADREKQDPEARLMRQSRNSSMPRIQSAAAAVAYLILALEQMGLGTVWMTGPTQAKPEIEKIIGVPSNMDFVAIVPVGYPAEIPQGQRKPVSEVCQIIR